VRFASAAELREVQVRHGRQLVLLGNLEIAGIEMLSETHFSERIKRAVDAGYGRYGTRVCVDAVGVAV
jgi:hypothetical protein